MIIINDKIKNNEIFEIIILESMPDGNIYCNILLKLYLKSLKNEGKLMLKEHIPYNLNMLSTITRHQIGTVEKAINIFKELGLLEVLDNGAIYMLDMQNYIGKTSSEGERKRKYRQRIDQELGQCPKLVRNLSENRPPELEKEKEKEKEIPLLSPLPIFEKNYQNENLKKIGEGAFKNWKQIANNKEIGFTNDEWGAVKLYATAKPSLPPHIIEIQLIQLDKWAQEGLDIIDSLLQSSSTKTLIKPHATIVRDGKDKRLYGKVVTDLRLKQIT